MGILINIPKEFEQHFQADRFEDSLHRLSADAHLLAGNYEQETAVMLIEAFASAVPVPPHGRLIDADELMKKLRGIGLRLFASEDLSKNQTLFAMAYYLKEAPTIIPAEEET